MKNKILRFASYVLVAALASALTFGYIQLAHPATKLGDLQSLIGERFIGEYNETKMEDAAATAMIDALGDRWSYYIPAADFSAYEDKTGNAYVGIGITITPAEDGTGFFVETVNENGPAQEAGMERGDIIVSVEGTDVAGMTTTEVSAIVKGEEGTSVTITVMRKGEAQNLFVTRRKIDVVVAEGSMLSGEIGLVRINNFDSRCAQETLNAIDALLNSDVKALVFDVRDNPGGYAKELVQILDRLLPEGELFRAEDYAGNKEVDHSDAKYLDIPMAVLVNGESYSAAEFFAAALQEYEAAVVVGEQTSGKGYFQNVYQFRDGSGVGLSVGKYYTPQGKSLAGVGITPDYVVPVDDETAAGIYYGTITNDEDPQLQKAVRYLEDVLEKKKT